MLLLEAAKMIVTLLLFTDVEDTEELTEGLVLLAKEAVIVKRAMIVVVKFFIFVGF